MRLLVLEHNGQTMNIAPNEIDDLIKELRNAKARLVPPSDIPVFSGEYITPQQARRVLDALTGGMLSEQSVRNRISNIWVACQRSRLYGSVPYEGLCHACYEQAADGLRYVPSCSEWYTAKRTSTIAMSKLSFVLYREHFIRMSYHGASKSAKEAYQLLVDYFIENGTN